MTTAIKASSIATSLIRIIFLKFILVLNIKDYRWSYSQTPVGMNSIFTQIQSNDTAATTMIKTSVAATEVITAISFVRTHMLLVSPKLTRTCQVSVRCSTRILPIIILIMNAQTKHFHQPVTYPITLLIAYRLPTITITTTKVSLKQQWLFSQ